MSVARAADLVAPLKPIFISEASTASVQLVSAKAKALQSFATSSAT